MNVSNVLMDADLALDLRRINVLLVSKIALIVGTSFLNLRHVLDNVLLMDTRLKTTQNSYVKNVNIVALNARIFLRVKNVN